MDALFYMIVVALFAFVTINALLVRVIARHDHQANNSSSKLMVWLADQAFFSQHAYPTWACSRGFKQHPFRYRSYWSDEVKVIFTKAELVELEERAQAGEAMSESELYKLWLKGQCPCEHCVTWPAFNMPMATRFVARRNVRKMMKRARKA